MRRLALRVALPASVGLAACGGQPGESAPEPAPDTTRDDAAPKAAVRSEPPRRRSRRFLLARVRDGRQVTVRARPRGKVVARLGARTEFGSKRVLGVVRRSGRWLATTIPELGNRRLAWIRKSRAVDVDATRTWIKADLSRRRVELRRGSRVVKRARVGIGRPGSPTPTGRFAVTDKLPGARFSAYYGRFIVALSGRQPRTPAGWTGGDRLALHGTPDPSRVGERTSAGCLVARDAALAEIAEEVPVGAPVVIRK